MRLSMKVSSYSVISTLCLSLLLFSIPKASAADKSFTRCSKLGDKISIRGDSFTCYQIGSSRLWAPTIPPNFGVKNNVKVNGPCPASSENQLYWEGRAKVICKKVSGRYIYQIKTWPSASSQTIAVNRMFKILRPAIDAGEAPADKKVKIEPGYESKLWFKDSLDAVDAGFKLNKALGAPVAEPPSYVLFWNQEWGKPFVKPMCMEWIKDGIGIGGVCPPNMIFSALGNAVTAKNFILNDPTKYQDEEQRYWIIAGMQHEVGHLGQQWTQANAQGLADISRINDFKPAWLREGVAEIFKIMAYAYQFNIDYQDARNLHVRNMGNRCTPTSLTELMGQGTTKSYCEYNNGTLAVEYLLAKTKDIKSLFAWEKSTSLDDVSMPISELQEKLFNKAFGLDLKNFMVEADAYIKKETA